ncbi:hypothetical protein C8J57DRAFT_1509210 [Mycena rebaudengoi]|nr:hypothetical protein C8J57DRAFT_1509210 [Mycena rebaudengoi]
MSSPARPSLDLILGPLLIGLIVSSIIFGVTCLQVYLYYTNFSSRDPLFLKLFRVAKVGSLWMLDAFHQVLISMSFYTNVVTNFGDYAALDNASWTIVVQICVGSFVETLVQMFYAWRIWGLSGKAPHIPAVITCLALGLNCLAIVYISDALRIPSLQESIKEDWPLGVAAIALEVATDLLIAGSMLYFLTKNRTSFHNTRKAVHTLIAYSVNSGILVTVVAICVLVALLVSSTTSVWVGIFFVLTKLYGCSFMSILNSREHVREQLYANSTDHAMVTIPVRPSYHATTPQDRVKKAGHIADPIFDGRAKQGSSSEGV